MNSDAQGDNDTTFISIIFAGDIMGHDTQIEAAFDSETNSYNYEPVFRYVSPYIQSADIAVANLEVTLAGPPFAGYPQFSSPDEFAIAAKEAGFDVMILANNHALDRGARGLARTHRVLDSLNFVHAGTYINEEDRNARHPLIVEKSGIKIALLNYTYGTNGIRIPEPYIVNLIDTSMISRDMEVATSMNPDFTIVTIHWGNEYERNENAEQRRIAGFLISKGADAVIGSHPHVVQPVDVNYSDTEQPRIVVYSLGNYVSNQRNQYRDGGIMFEMKLAKSSEGSFIAEYSYLPTWVYREQKQEAYNFYILPVSRYENNSIDIKLNDDDLYRLQRFAGDTREHLKGIPEKN